MAISAADVKKLREMTGAGMMECKKALTESEGNIEEAVELLRKRGVAKAEKKADRASTEGVVAIALSDDQKQAVVLELNCETDFVGRNEQFIGIAQNLAEMALKNDLDNTDAVLEFADNGTTGKEIITQAVLKLGENIQLGRVAKVEASGFIASYVHMNGKIGVAVQMAGEASDDAVAAAKDVAMQVAAMKPVAAYRDGVPADLVAKEKAIYVEQVRQSGKPENLLEKIAEGKMNKFYSEVVLTEQAFVKDTKLSIADYIAQVSKKNSGDLKIENFHHLAIGE
jgi:elongation factor Ts